MVHRWFINGLIERKSKMLNDASLMAMTINQLEDGCWLNQGFIDAKEMVNYR